MKSFKAESLYQRFFIYKNTRFMFGKSVPRELALPVLKELVASGTIFDMDDASLKSSIFNHVYAAIVDDVVSNGTNHWRYKDFVRENGGTERLKELQGYGLLSVINIKSKELKDNKCNQELLSLVLDSADKFNRRSKEEAIPSLFYSFDFGNPNTWVDCFPLDDEKILMFSGDWCRVLNKGYVPCKYDTLAGIAAMASMSYNNAMKYVDEVVRKCLEKYESCGEDWFSFIDILPNMLRQHYLYKDGKRRKGYDYGYARARHALRSVNGLLDAQFSSIPRRCIGFDRQYAYCVMYGSPALKDFLEGAQDRQKSMLNGVKVYKLVDGHYGVAFPRGSQKVMTLLGGIKEFKNIL